MYLDVLQNRWLILVLLGGTALVLGVVLAYMAIWRGRDVAPAGEDAAGAKPSARPWLRSFFPWVLVLTYAGMLAYVVIYTFVLASNPPNW
jgi:putative exporter of polyketide antibiotics